MDYKSTLNLPKTDFPMKADLPTREPVQCNRWEEMGCYQAMVKAREGRPRFLLHDGPPYANGHIHFGHILNKVLKDIVVKSKAMAGYYTPFIPGWDCHGLPIELQALKEKAPAGAEQAGDAVLRIRKACRAYAEKYIDIQRAEFKRLGCLGDWANPYRTMDFAYQAAIARAFGQFVANGMVTTGLKPIHWCSSCRTALAEAEVEYTEHTSPSIYVGFPLTEGDDLRPRAGMRAGPVTLVIWTTTPWTIPANLAIALHPDLPYCLVEVGQELWVIAEGLLETVMTTMGIEQYKVRAHCTARELERRECHHPLCDRTSLVVIGEHVTLDVGTGLVHTAPGHGQEDYEVGARYGLAPFAPIDDAGRFTDEAGLPWLTGVSVWAANPIIMEKLKGSGALVYQGQVTHQYPHCWRCHRPILFRATEQWFIGMATAELRARALKAIEVVQWIPPWGRNRIFGMIEQRPDWCISRQRSWGVPIIAVTCETCHAHTTSPELIEHVAKRFETDGADVWFSQSPLSLLPHGFACPRCGSTGPFTKETDILDVWFDSGTSFSALKTIFGLAPPIDLYLEGSDQHRGWFHSALLVGIGTQDSAPYRAVLTHGFVVDHEGRKYSKSAKNYVPPEKVLNRYGAEILRLWVAAEDYRNDIRVSDEILARVAESYRKIRNTLRFLLGNLSNFEPDRDALPDNRLTDLDKWALKRVSAVIKRCRRAYDDYEFHLVYHTLNAFCTVDLSAFYLDIIKDRLYCEGPKGELRRAAQTACWRIADEVTRLMAPILSFTADEVWQYLPKPAGAPGSVFLTDLPEGDRPDDDAEADRWERLRAIRGEATKALEAARQAKTIGSPLEAALVIEASADMRKFLEGFGPILPDLFLTSALRFGKAQGGFCVSSEAVPGLTIGVERAGGTKCARCWKFHEDAGHDASFPDVCARCAEVLHAL
ncbi:MAG: isoleucine--tRNA ligase [Deltaproteobacteria bacterium]|nr:isoleucine--tRNA ligase [Deltaproteobacteria bacterium]